MRWHPLLKEIRARRLDLARLDPRAGMPILPPGGATPSAIAAVERRLGRPLPPSYRELLSLHDGIPHFYQGVSLLSAHHLTRGTFVDLARLVIDLGETSRVDSARGRGPTLVPFGIDASGETIFAWDMSAPGPGGELGVVLWMNEIGERAPSFPSFLDLVLAMLESDIDERRRALEPRERRCAAMAEAILSAGVESTRTPPVSGVRSLEEDEADEACFAA